MAALRNLVTRMRIPATAALWRRPRVSPAAGSRGLSDYSQSQDQDALHARRMYNSLYGSYELAKDIKRKYERSAKWGQRLTYLLGITSIVGYPYMCYQEVMEKLTMEEAPKQVTMADNQVVTAMDVAAMEAEIEAFIDEAVEKAAMEGGTVDEAAVKATKEAARNALMEAVTEKAV